MFFTFCQECWRIDAYANDSIIKTRATLSQCCKYIAQNPMYSWSKINWSCIISSCRIIKKYWSQHRVGIDRFIFLYFFSTVWDQFISSAALCAAIGSAKYKLCTITSDYQTSFRLQIYFRISWFIIYQSSTENYSKIYILKCFELLLLLLLLLLLFNIISKSIYSSYFKWGFKYYRNMLKVKYTVNSFFQ